ncbi:MAG: phosphodiesterase [Rhodobacteraceae bacterium]|nr:phosphodiesterase [Paracoccaceae bacterium]
MLPEPFRTIPIAHRALHGPGRPENSLSAVRAAVAAGFGIEIDLQLSADGEAVVFHDRSLQRLTGRMGETSALTAAELAALPLLGGDGEGPPLLAQVLDVVAGRGPVLVEIKDQSAGAGIGPLEAACARAVEGYRGPLAVMSFSPASMAEMARLAPDLPRGLVTWSWEGKGVGHLSEHQRQHLRDIADFERVGACFISHEASDLSRPRVAELARSGVPVLCWTIRSPRQEASARRVACNITFEDYLPGVPDA